MTGLPWYNPAMIDDIIGRKFGSLFVICQIPTPSQIPTPKGKKGNRPWCLCLCDCNSLVDVRLNCLKTGKTRSCGCSRIIHGHAISRNGKPSVEYIAWTSMIKRCEDPNNTSYENYGGRGIKVCERWRHSFANFLADVGLKPSPDHSLDRKDNDGNYEPANCRWATREEQANNQQNNRLISYNGEIKTLAEWAKFLNVPHYRISYRLNNEWTIEQALFSPPDIDTMITHNGITRTLTEWSEFTGIHKNTIHWRLRRGWSNEKALTTPVRPKRSHLDA